MKAERSNVERNFLKKVVEGEVIKPSRAIRKGKNHSNLKNYIKVTAIMEHA